jgi:hypothetical protein
MTTFDSREKAFEDLFAHDEGLRFKAYARRSRLLGLWAAEKLGKSGADAEAYARVLVEAGVTPQGEAQLLARVHADFAAAGVDQSDHRIERTMQELLARAVAEVKAGH